MRNQLFSAPAHVARAPDAAGRRACSRRAAKVEAAAYPSGFFVELVLQHNWPPRFVSRWSASRSFVPQAEAARVNRQAGIGHGAADLGLPGAAEHIKRWRRESAVKR